MITSISIIIPGSANDNDVIARKREVKYFIFSLVDCLLIRTQMVMLHRLLVNSQLLCY